MSARFQIQLVIDNIPRRDAAAIIAALEPDNINFPKGQDCTIENIDNKLVLSVYSRDNMNQLIGTVDEILAHIYVVLGVTKQC